MNRNKEKIMLEVGNTLTEIGKAFGYVEGFHISAYYVIGHIFEGRLNFDDYDELMRAFKDAFGE